MRKNERLKITMKKTQIILSNNHLYHSHETSEIKKYAEKCNFCAVILVIRNCTCPALYKKDEICV